MYKKINADTNVTNILSNCCKELVLTGKFRHCTDIYIQYVCVYGSVSVCLCRL